jgi:hypothetical protein
MRYFSRRTAHSPSSGRTWLWRFSVDAPQRLIEGRNSKYCHVCHGASARQATLVKFNFLAGGTSGTTGNLSVNNGTLRQCVEVPSTALTSRRNKGMP